VVRGHLYSKLGEHKAEYSGGGGGGVGRGVSKFFQRGEGAEIKKFLKGGKRGGIGTTTPRDSLSEIKSIQAIKTARGGKGGGNKTSNSFEMGSIKRESLRHRASKSPGTSGGGWSKKMRERKGRRMLVGRQADTCGQKGGEVGRLGNLQ